MSEGGKRGARGLPRNSPSGSTSASAASGAGTRAASAALSGQVGLSGESIRLTGWVDVRTVGTLRMLLHTAIDRGTGPLRVDVAELELGDHAALGVLLGGARRARAAGRSMVLVDAPGGLGRMFAADRLGRLLRFEEVGELVHVGHA